MRVIDCEPGCWFLLQEEQEYYLDVRCDRGAVSFSVTIRLTPEERALDAGGGRTHLVSLADEISRRSDPVEPRQIRDRELDDRITVAIKAWNQQRP